MSPIPAGSVYSGWMIPEGEKCLQKWSCRNGHKERIAYTRSRPMRYCIHEFKESKWIVIAAFYSFENALKKAKAWEAHPLSKGLRLRDNWGQTFISLKHYPNIKYISPH